MGPNAAHRTRCARWSGKRRARTSKVALATIPPQRAGGRGAETRSLQRYRASTISVRALAAAEGAPLIDVYSGMKDDSATHRRRRFASDAARLRGDGRRVLRRDKGELRSAAGRDRPPMDAPMTKTDCAGHTDRARHEDRSGQITRFEDRDDFGNYEANLRFLRDAGLRPGGGTLLEIGSGKGRMLNLLRQEGHDVHGRRDQRLDRSRRAAACTASCRSERSTAPGCRSTTTPSRPSSAWTCSSTFPIRTRTCAK